MQHAHVTNLSLISDNCIASDLQIANMVQTWSHEEMDESQL